VEEVISFYQKKHIIPRFYMYEPEKQGAFIDILKAKGFKLEEFSHPVQLWNRTQLDLAQTHDIQIEIVSEETYSDA
jgi:hypothetical protein